ncbi:MAG: hypothetical protein AAFN91_07760 [Pseudomonadota bacterium]
MANKENLSAPGRSPFTLLAVTALAISNLMAGVMQGNTLLILASSVLSGGFAYVYAVRSGMISGIWSEKSEMSQPEANLDPAVSSDAQRRFPLWLFLGFIFLMMPAILMFLQTVEQ